MMNTTAGYVTGGDVRMTFDEGIGYGDLTVVNRDLERDPGLETAIIVSLFSNQRATENDALPDADGSREGWWGDEVSPSPVGSKLWLIGRDKMQMDNLIPLAEQYAQEALQWMIDDGVASEIEVTASRAGTDTLRLDVEVKRPQLENTESFKYYYNWVEQITRSG
jgi:phage gp46-like protein